MRPLPRQPGRWRHPTDRPEALEAVPSIYDLKPRFQALLRPAVRALVERGVTPNHLTASAVVGSVLAGLLIPLPRERPGFLLPLPLWLFARPPRALDPARRCPGAP